MRGMGGSDFGSLDCAIGCAFFGRLADWRTPVCPRRHSVLEATMDDVLGRDTPTDSRKTPSYNTPRGWEDRHDPNRTLRRAVVDLGPGTLC